MNYSTSQQYESSKASVIRTDSAGRDVTDLPGLWSEDDTITDLSQPFTVDWLCEIGATSLGQCGPTEHCYGFFGDMGGEPLIVYSTLTRLGTEGILKNHHLICLPHHAPKIIDGTKTTTIRAPRSRQIEVGDTITFARWTAKPYRSKQERVRVVTVTSVQTIRVTRETCRIDVDGETVSPADSWTLAVGDGFQNSAELVDYLTSDKQPEFSGFIYGWD